MGGIPPVAPVWCAVLLGLSGCAFDGAGVVGEDGGGPPDVSGGADASGTPGPDASPESVDASGGPAPDSICAYATLDLCAAGGPGAPLDVDGDLVLDTDSDPLCATTAQSEGPDLCLVYVDRFTIAGGASLTAVGSRPLAVASVQDVVIDGLLDVSSRREGHTGAGANYDGCADPQEAEEDGGGAGGGAGGSFGGRGGDGGTGDTDQSVGFDGQADGGTAAPAVAAPGFVRGGCEGDEGGDESDDGGEGGDGGDSGGAVLVLSQGDLTIGAAGVIRATGAGGEGGEVQSGGGGGGSGGYIALEAGVIDVRGRVSANGGGGGEGGTRLSGDPISGNPGADGGVDLTPAPGGSGSPGSGGDGGDGSAGSTEDGEPGESTIVGAGGGGGGAGVIFFEGSAQGDGVVTPPAL